MKRLTLLLLLFSIVYTATALWFSLPSFHQTTSYLELLQGNQTAASGDSVLFLSLAWNADSFGAGRNASDLLQLLHFQAEGLNRRCRVDVALLVGNDALYSELSDYLRLHLQQYPAFGRLLLFKERSSSGQETRQHRHYDAVQAARRQRIAMRRNELLYLALRDDHQAVVWIDADLLFIPPGLVGKMWASGKDIVTASCVLNRTRDLDYDQNAWKGRRTSPTPQERHARSTFVPSGMPGETWHLLSLRQPHDEFVEINSVGGTTLFAKADIFRIGVNFPPYYVVGSDETGQGWDGIETEGLCLVASLFGFRCWAMPMEVTIHADH
ncbi:hypothetical protein HDU91_007395 [Kappamyces sp. JEL0680]|nr:hypothetical protein HDU91_007395 [Kappamyces sp. JEL0680]